MSFLTSSDSTTASTTKSASARSFIAVVSVIRPSSSACSASVSLPRFTARAVECSRCWRPRSQRLVVQLDAHDGEAVAGEHLGDAGTHGAEADDADGAEGAPGGGHRGLSGGLRRAAGGHLGIMARGHGGRREQVHWPVTCARPPARGAGLRAAPGRFPARETRRCPLPGRLRRTADRPPADGHPGADDQGRRVGARALRRRLLQAAELDVPAVHAARGQHRRRPGRVDGHRARRPGRHPADPDRGDPPRHPPRARHRPGPAEGRRREAPPGAARRAPRDAVGRADPGPPRVPHRDRPGRPHVPRRRRA